MFFSYEILSQKLKMSETTKDTEMEPCMTQKSKKKSLKKFVCNFCQKAHNYSWKCNMMFFTFGILSQKLKMSETKKDTKNGAMYDQKKF